MSKLKKVGDSPINSRIHIDYSGVKPDVRFSYPSKKHQVTGSMFFPILIVWTVFALFSLYMAGAINSFRDLSVEKPLGDTQCREKVIEFLDNADNQNNLINKICKPIPNIFETVGDTLYKKAPIFNPIEISKQAFWGFLLILYIWGVPCLIYFPKPFKKQWLKLYPKYQALTSRKKIKIFKSNEVEHSEKHGWYCEIPVFSNVILDFEAKKDFSKQLKYLEIEEHKFQYYRLRSKLKKAKNKKQELRNKKILERRKKHRLNEWIWYARFYFKEKPFNGQLQVIFK